MAPSPARRPVRFAVAAMSGVLAGCAASPRAERGPPPYAALTSPSAALTVVLDEVCLPAVLESRPIEALALGRYLRPVDPKRAGSPTSSAAWRLASLQDVHVFALANGGCSLALEGGDAEALSRQAVSALLSRRPDMAPAPPELVDGGRAERTAFCSAQGQPTVVAVYLKRVDGRRRVSFLANIFRAQADRPAFCPPL